MSSLKESVNEYLAWLASHGYAAGTVRSRRYYLASLIDFLAERDVHNASQVTASLLDSYQRHLFHHKKVDGQPLSFRTQSQRLIPVKGLFAWLTRSGTIAFDPAISMVLPKTEHRLPEAVLSIDEVESVLAGPDTSTALGVRDRAILEVFYSTAIRRMELINLHVTDIDFARGSLFVRQGKGARDRFVPIGERARIWVTRYLDDVRPQLERRVTHPALFLSATGGAIGPDVMSRMVSAYVSAGAPTKHGSCHLFRHTTATLMLEAGADVRYIAEMLGHQKLETTMSYTRVSMSKLLEVHTRCHPAEQAKHRFARVGSLKDVDRADARQWSTSILEPMEPRFTSTSPLGQLLLEHRDAVLAISARNHAGNVRVFGSVVRGEDSTSSDVDFLVEFDHDANPLDILALGCELEEELGVKVDVCTTRGLRPFVKEEIVAQAVRL
jgi:integrase/recombinase XerD